MSTTVEKPDFVAMEEGERIAHITSLVPLSDYDISLLNSLCSVWKPFIRFYTFLKSLESGLRMEDSLVALINKLSDVGLGVIVYETNENKKIVPGSVLLTSPFSKLFFNYFVASYYCRGAESIKPQFLTDPIFFSFFPSQKKLPIESITIDVFQKKSFFEIYNKYPLSFLVFPDSGKKILFSGVALESLYQFAISYLFLIFEGGKGSLSAICGLTESDFLGISREKQRTYEQREKKTFSWEGIFEKILPQIEEIKTRAGRNFDNFEIAIDFLVAHSVIFQKHKSEKTSAQERYKELSEEVLTSLKKKDAPLSLEDFEIELTVLDELSGDSSKKFRETYMKFKEAEIPMVLKLKESVIHKDNIISCFESQLYQLNGRIQGFYTDKIETALRPFSNSSLLLFTSYDNLIDDLERFAKESFSELTFFLERPNLLFKMYLTSLADLSEVDRQKTLQIYFENKEKKLTFKPLAAMVKLDFNDIFLKVFNKTSFLNRVCLRISGKYKALEKQILQYEEIVKKENLSSSS